MLMHHVPMADREKDDNENEMEAKVPLDEDFARDIKQAHEVTGIRSRRDLIRHCVRKVAREGSK